MARFDEQVLLASGARTTSQTLAEQTNYELADSLEVFLDLTAFTTAASLTLNIQLNLPGVGYVTVFSSAVITAIGRTYLRLIPGASEVANQVRSTFLSNQWRVTVTHGNANSHTYSVGSRAWRRGDR